MTKKILIVNDNVPDQINGVVTTYKNLESYAADDGYIIDHLHPGWFRYIDCPMYNEVKLALPINMGKKIEEIRPDHIHLATEGPLGMCARKYLAMAGHRYNSAYHTKFPEGLKTLIGIPENVSWSVVRWFHKYSEKVLTTTPSMVQQLKDHGFGDNVTAWTRGVDRSLFRPAMARSVNKQNPVMVCVSRVSLEKNLEDFFRLDRPGTKIMVGDGPQLNTYKKNYPDVHFVGAKRGLELASYFQMADIFVFPSRWDTFGLVMIEAMACGTPVAAYPVQGPRDVIDEGVTGCMHNDLNTAVDLALQLDRDGVYNSSLRWSWKTAWEILRDNLTDVR